MVKKIMFYLMICLTALRFIVLAYMLSSEPQRLPIAVMVSSGIVVWFGIGLLCRNIVKAYITRWELQLYYMISCISVSFNLIMMKIFSRVEVNLLDLSVVGSFLDLAVFITLLYYSRKEYQKNMARKARRHAQARVPVHE